MLIHLSESLIREGECKRYEAPIEFQTFKCKAGMYKVVDAKSALVDVTNKGNMKYHLDVQIDCALRMPCARCLKLMDVPFQIETETDVDLNQTEQGRVDDLDEQTYIQGYHFDVDEFIRSELFLNMPMRVLCKEDCEGIGSRYGTDPEDGECEGRPLDPRMAAIQKIFDEANR